MSIQVLSAATMGDNTTARLPSTPSPTLTGISSSRRHTEQLLLANAGILASVGQGDDQKQQEEMLLKRSPADTSGIVSHLRASSSSRQDIESILRGRGNSYNQGLAQQALGLNPYGQGLAMLPSDLNRYAEMLLSQQQNAAREAAVAQFSQSIATPSLSMLPSASALFSSQLSIPRGLQALGLTSCHPFSQSAFSQDAMFAMLNPSGLPAAAPRKAVKRSPIVLFMECDEDSLSEYQCLIRKQIELFEADKEEAASSVQGRNKQIVEGQVGIRCRHCTVVPPRRRQKGCMYFPTKLDRIYQAAQNLSAFHLCEHCKHVPEDVRKKILVLRERKSPAGGGKRYWGEGVRCMGVYEDSSGLRFAPRKV
jgi:hypothetical protein